jgi:hypothetical protein
MVFNQADGFLLGGIVEQQFVFWLVQLRKQAFFDPVLFFFIDLWVFAGIRVVFNFEIIVNLEVIVFLKNVTNGLLLDGIAHQRIIILVREYLIELGGVLFEQGIQFRLIIECGRLFQPVFVGIKNMQAGAAANSAAGNRQLGLGDAKGGFAVGALGDLTGHKY